MAATAIRAAMKAKLVTELTKALPLVAVSNGWPGRNLERDHVWVDRVTGTVEFPLMMAGRKHRDDKFTVRVIFQSSQPGDSIAETDVRAEQLYAALENVIAADPGIGTMNGIVHALIDTVEGPMGELTDEGAVSFMFADIAVHARLI